MTDLNIENQEILKNIKEHARTLLNEEKVEVIIGYEEGSVPLTSSPVFIRSAEEVDRLTWNNLCYVNLAKFLNPPLIDIKDGKKIPLKVGIVAKGCTARTIIHLAKENQIELEDIMMIGIPCNGIINRRRIEKEIGQKEIEEVSINGENIIVKGEGFEKSFPFKEYINELCKTCRVKAPPFSKSVTDYIIGESQEISSIEDNFSDLDEYEAKTPDEKWEYIKGALKDCTRCYACREACPLCYCNLCFVDQNLPTWFGKTTELPEIIVFHMIRALHVAGRCVSCGACSSVCPMGIDLNLITRKIEKIVKERFNFTSGLDLETMPPMMTQRMDDKQEFMLEEH
ncbi:MAG: 4Fe-4S ferredoxin [Promethearchaeota archaeon]